jgi:hypothetical protein
MPEGPESVRCAGPTGIGWDDAAPSVWPKTSVTPAPTVSVYVARPGLRPRIETQVPLPSTRASNGGSTAKNAASIEASSSGLLKRIDHGASGGQSRPQLQRASSTRRGS